MKVRQTILLTNIIVVVLFLIVSVAVYAGARKASDSISDIMSGSEELLITADLEGSLNEMVRVARGYIILKDKEMLTAYENSFDALNENAERIKTIDNPEQQELANRIVRLGLEYDRLTREAMGLAGKGAPMEKVAEKVREAKVVFDKIKPLATSFRELERTHFKGYETGAARAIAILNTVLVAGVVLSTVLAIAGAFFVSRWISSSVKAATASVASSVTEISSTVTQHERTAAGQASSVNETATTVDELGAASRKVSEQAEEATAGARNIMALSEDGLKTVRQTLAGMTVIKDKSNAIAEQILKLSEQTAQIGTIANMVTDIAGQINMLALNAAVEAVRAGEHGKGFSVIAQEVRKLADQGKKSAERVNLIVAEIQRATNSTIMAAEEGAKTIDEGSRLAQQTEDAFSSVSSSVNGAFENFRQISLNVAQQAAAIKQVVEAMNAINAGARDTAAGIAQTKVGLDNIKTSANGLNDMF